MDFFLAQLINGLTLGAEYALIASGLALIFGVLGIVNFAQGELFMVAAYLLYLTQVVLGLPYAVAAPLTVAAMVAFGALFYLLVLHRVRAKGWQIQLVATLGASVLLTNAMIVVAGSLPKTAPNALTRSTLAVGPASFATQRVVVLAATLATVVLLTLFLRRARLGKAMRAVSQDRAAAGRVGIDARLVGLLAVVMAAGLAGVAAATVAPMHNIDPTMGARTILMAFAAVIVGGMGNILGAVLCGIGLGVVEAIATGYLSSAYGTAFVFAAMILTLLVRPAGLFGQQVRL